MDKRGKIIFLFIFVFLFSVSFVFATDYYATPNDSLSNKISQLTPGDTLILKDGTYYQSLIVNVSGNNTHPITIKAENDGKAVIDGQGVKRPCYIALQQYINLEGLICTNSSDNSIMVSGSDHINIRRLSGVNAGTKSANFIVKEFDDDRHPDDGKESSYILFEDCIAYGDGEKLFDVATADHVTIRRSWGQYFYQTNHPNPGAIFNMYPATNSVFENIIGVVHPSSSEAPISTANTRNPWSNAFDNNTLIGSVVVGSSGFGHNTYSGGRIAVNNKVDNNVFMNHGHGTQNKGTKEYLFTNNTVANIYVGNGFSTADPTESTQTGCSQFVQSSQTWNIDSNYKISSTVKNNVFVNIRGKGILKETSKCNFIEYVSHDFNTYWNITGDTYSGLSSGHHDYNETIQPSYDILTYSKGAYLIRPSNLIGCGEGGTGCGTPQANGPGIGAEVLYQYENGVLTNKSLWPWPMEDRICAETGFSVTWENASTSPNGCGEGLWKTLNGVYNHNIINSSDINTDGFTNINDVRICMNSIIDNSNVYFINCSNLALPSETTDLNDVNEIINNIF